MRRNNGDETEREYHIRKKADAGNRYLYFCMVIFVILLGVPTTQAIENSYNNCVRFNSALDYFAKNATAPSSPLTPQQKVDRAVNYEKLHGHCRGVWPFQP